ncbi:MAG: hypothetical protein IID44_08095 [Planctomycetes bacterium]|nr:hypothetical protein [Planctomycetota bacterium]
MNSPTPDQARWAADSWNYVAMRFEERTRDEEGDFTPMLRLIDHICTSCEVDLLSAGTSLFYLVVASAAHVSSPNKLAHDAPAIGILQLDMGFEFRDANGNRCKVAFGQASRVLDAQLVRLGMMVDEYDHRTSKQIR